MMKREIFREYDIRGIVGADLTEDVVRNIGRAVAAYMRERGKTRASLGRDCRLSSDDFGRLVAEGMVEGGLSVTDLGVVPTPLFYFSLFTMEVEGGVMVTGSHNPPDYNGFKVAFGKSTLFGSAIQEIADIIEGRRFVSGRGGLFHYPGIKEDYYNFLRGNISIDRSVKAAVDAGNGTGGVIAVPIMEEMGAEVIALNCEMDGRFPSHFPDPTVETNLGQLRDTVLARSAELGIAYDGDADRIGVVDNEGGVIRGDYLMIIFAREIAERHKGATFVSEVKCSENLFADIAKRGGRPIMWKAGHSLIKQKMKETGALFGGEMSGHMFFADRFFGFDDAIYASLRLLEILARDERPLSEFLADLPRTWSTPEIRIDCPEQLKFGVVRKITEYYRQRFEIVDTDGVRVVLPDGWGLVRASNTQPVLVLRFEARSPEALERIEGMVREDLARFL
jgi:phosphomannomutase/phosphoglucomutase